MFQVYSKLIHLHVFFFRFFSIRGYHKILNLDSYAIQYVLVVLSILYMVVCIC